METGKLFPPTPVLFPDELLLRSMPFKSSSIEPHFPLLRLALHEQRRLRTYFKQNTLTYHDSTKHTVSGNHSLSVTMDPARIRPRFILVYVTTQRILIVPFIQQNFSINDAFSIGIFSIANNISCHDTNYKGMICVNQRFVEFCFEAVPGGSCILRLESKSRGRTAEFASLISSLRFSASVANFNSGTWNSEKLTLQKGLNFDGELYYGKLVNCDQLPGGLSSNGCTDNFSRDGLEYLPGYQESEICMREYLRHVGILQNLILIAKEEGSQFFDENNIDSNERSIRFSLVEDYKLKKRFGEYYYLFLCCCAMNYAERNKEDAAQMIHDNEWERYNNVKTPAREFIEARSEEEDTKADSADEEDLLIEFFQQEGYLDILSNILKEDTEPVSHMKKSISVGTNGTIETMDSFYEQNTAIDSTSIQSSVFTESETKNEIFLI